MSKSFYKKGDLVKLVLLAQSGDNRALEAIIRRVQKQVYAMFSHLTDNKSDISDLTQETLVKMARNIHKLKEPVHFKQWLNKIVTNTFYDYVKKHRLNYIETDENKLNEIRDKTGCEPGEKCIFTEIEKLIKSALYTLPQAMRLALLLREYEGLSYEDIAKITNTALGTVKSRISRARFILKEELKDFI